jgi:tetratricopeptide (TPR) repeat protein
MKKVYFSKLAIFLTLAVAISGCAGLQKMKDDSSKVKYDATPKVLELQNGEVQGTISGTYPQKYFNKNAVVTITPILKYEGGELALDPKKLQGEAVQANDQAIPFEAGGSFTQPVKFTYKDEYMLSDIELKVTAQLKKETLDIGTFKVADGIITTPKLVKITPKTISMPDKYVQVTSEDKTADIHYLINRAEIRSTELKNDAIKNLNDYIKSVSSSTKDSIKAIEIWSTASPDGPVHLNTKLSESRENSAKDYLKGEIRKQKIKSLEKKDDLIKYLTTPEDWDGFKDLMEKSDIKDKDLVLRVLSMYSDPEVREKEIMKISEAFDEIKVKILPELRRSKFTVKVDAIGYSDAELLQLADTNPDTLKLEEILHAASLVQDLNKKAALYKKASDKFPTDVRAKNNLGDVDIQLGKLDSAKVALEAAKAIDNNDAVKTNMGALALLQGDIATAEELSTAAVGAGDAPNYNLGIINIIKGKYDAATGYFGNASEYNAALAKLLSKNYNGAITTIGNSKDESGDAYYLKAILGARTDNSDMVFNNLRTAVGKDMKLKAYAKKDVEFLKYFNDETFKSIIQ